MRTRHIVPIIIGGAVGIATGAGLVLGFTGGDGSTKLKDQPGYKEAHDQAEIYCTLGGVVGPNGPDSLYDPEYLACVDVETKKNMEKD